MVERRPEGFEMRTSKSDFQSQNKFKLIEEWIESGPNLELINMCESFVKNNKGVTTSQLRNIYATVIKLKMTFDKNRFLMLKPRLAYAGARDKKMFAFTEILSRGITIVLKHQDNPEAMKQKFNRFADFYEAVICYQKALKERR